MAKNKNKKMVGIGVIAAIGLLAFAILLAFAAPDVVTRSIDYQGRLTDSAGEPLSGTYSMTFILYEVASGGTALDADTHSVEVIDGLFNMNINFDLIYFDGRALWLGIRVGTDAEMKPRQELRPVPYALSLRPGARIIGSGTALHAESTHTPGRGIRGYATATSGTNYGVEGKSRSPDGYGGYFYNYGGGIGVYGKGDKYGGYFTTNQGGTRADHNAGVNVSTAYDCSDGVRAYTTGDYSTGIRAYTSGYSSDGVVAETYDDYSEGVYAHTDGRNSAGVAADTTGDYSEGVYAHTDGYNSAGVSADTTGDYSEGVSACTHGNDSEGVYARTYGEDSEGFYARTYGDDSEGVYAHTDGRNSAGVAADTTGDYSYGVYAGTTGDNSEGVYARTSGEDSDGVHARTSGEDSDGVHAYSAKGYGVYGEGKYGGYFTTNQDGHYFNPNAGVYVLTAHINSEGVHAHTDGYSSTGVSADTTGNYSAGVSAYTTGDRSDGVYARTHGDDSEGVYARTHGEDSEGVYARTHGNDSEGVYARTHGDDSEGVHAHTYGDSFGVSACSDTETAIYAVTGRSDHRYGVRTPDKIKAMSYDTTSSDVAEYFAVDEDVEAGTVMVIDPAGGSRLRCSTEAYDTTVAGIVSTSPGMSLGINEEGNEGEKLIAVAGRVTCKVDASYAPIKSGDLLTTSDTPGYAMKATNPQIGTILGKALEPMDSGTGVIEVLVTLQ